MPWPSVPTAASSHREPATGTSPVFPASSGCGIAASGERVAELSGHLGPVFSLAFSGDGRILASGSLDGTVKIWDVTARSERATLRSDLPGWVQALALAPGWANASSFANGGRVTLWDGLSGRKLGVLDGHREDVDSLAISPDGQILASGSRDNSVKLWDLATLKEQATLAGPGGLDLGPRLRPGWDACHRRRKWRGQGPGRMLARDGEPSITSPGGARSAWRSAPMARSSRRDITRRSSSCPPAAAE